jgi:hypothetical protein
MNADEYRWTERRVTDPPDKLPMKLPLDRTPMNVASR